MGTMDGIDFTNWSEGDFTKDSDKVEPVPEIVSFELCPLTPAGNLKFNSIGSLATPAMKVGQGDTGSPALRSAKRSLKLSPSTPVGLTRKIPNVCNKSSIKTITLEEDVEMEDLEFGIVKPEPVEISETVGSGRKFIRGLRRRLIDASTSSEPSKVAQKSPGREVAKEKESTDKNVAVFKGKSVRFLRQKNKLQHINYKSTKKKKFSKDKEKARDKTQDRNQRLIDEFIYSNSRSNQVIVGLKSEVAKGANEPVTEDFKVLAEDDMVPQ